MAHRRGLLGIALFLTGCYNPGEGVEPPLRQLYFPVGLAVTPAATRLYVVNSDFDLQYSGGALQALDLERIRSLVPRSCKSDAECGADRVCDAAGSGWCVAASGEHAGEPCGPFGEKTPGQRLLSPGRCGYVDLENPQDGGSSLVVAAVGISAFATDVIYRPRPTGPGGRLFVPARGDATLHYIETIDDSEPEQMPFELECGQSGNGGDCADRFRVGDDPDEENSRDLRMPPEPFGIAALDDARAIVITHQTEGAASLFVNDDSAWGDGTTSFGTGPKLEFVVGGMPSRPIGVAAIPEPALVEQTDIPYEPGFLVTFRNSATVELLRFYDDEAAQPERPFLQRAGAVGIPVNSVGIDSRGVALSAHERQACEAKCATGDVPCLTECAGIPLGVYIANRTPSTLIFGQTRTNSSATGSDDLPHFAGSEPVSFGPSRVIAGEIVDDLGQRVPRIFVICFDAKRIFVYDPVLNAIDFTIDTGRGPHSFVIDIGADYAYGYVGHFTDSYVGVVQLDQRSPNFGQIVLTVAKPSAPRASK